MTGVCVCGCALHCGSGRWSRVRVTYVRGVCGGDLRDSQPEQLF